MELYYPATEWDLESGLQALAGVLFTLLVAAGSVYLCAPEFAQKYIDKWYGTKQAPVASSAGPAKAATSTGGTSDDWDDVIIIGGQKQQQQQQKKKTPHKK